MCRQKLRMDVPGSDNTALCFSTVSCMVVLCNLHRYISSQYIFCHVIYDRLWVDPFRNVGERIERATYSSCSRNWMRTAGHKPWHSEILKAQLMTKKRLTVLCFDWKAWRTQLRMLVLLLRTTLESFPSTKWLHLLSPRPCSLQGKHWLPAMGSRSLWKDFKAKGSWERLLGRTSKNCQAIRPHGLRIEGSAAWGNQRFHQRLSSLVSSRLRQSPTESVGRWAAAWRRSWSAPLALRSCQAGRLRGGFGWLLWPLRTRVLEGHHPGPSPISESLWAFGTWGERFAKGAWCELGRRRVLQA